jgi:prostaglandin-H2 D-isomerase / glutathione transferase
MTSATTYELTYFDAPGRGEAIRILLHAAGVEFTDTRIQSSADWTTIQPTTPLGSVPILTINGTDHHVQSLALMRYAAKLGGFYPDRVPLQALVVDEVMDTCNELLSKAPRSRDKEELKRLRQEFKESTMTRYSSFMEEIVAKNKEATGSSLVVGTTVTVADIAIYALLKTITGSACWDYVDPGSFFKNYPGLVAVSRAVDNNDKVLAYYASKKET